MSPSPEAAVRRFTAVWTASVAIKVAALALFLVLITSYLGGHL